ERDEAAHRDAADRDVAIRSEPSLGIRDRLARDRRAPRSAAAVVVVAVAAAVHRDDDRRGVTEAREPSKSSSLSRLGGPPGWRNEPGNEPLLRPWSSTSSGRCPPPLGTTA